MFFLSTLRGWTSVFPLRQMRAFVPSLVSQNLSIITCLCIYQSTHPSFYASPIHFISMITYLLWKKYTLHLFYVPDKFSLASPFSTLNSLSLCLCLSHSLFVTPPFLCLSLSPPPLALPPSPWHFTLSSSLFLSPSVCSCITYHPDRFPTLVIGVSRQQMLTCFIKLLGISCSS